MAAMYCLSQFFRSSTALIAVDLTREFHLGPERLSLLGAAFFYAFALAQLPLGPALDRFGARRIVLGAALVGAAGSALFGLAQGWPGLLAGRILMGLGMAPILMGALKLAADWLPPGNFGTVSGVILAVGTLGSLLAASPLAGLVEKIGWRASFGLFAALTAAGAAAVAWLVEDRPFTGRSRGPGSAGPLDGLRRVLGQGNFWAMAPLALVGYASIASLQGLWAGPFLMESLGYTRAQTGGILLCLGFASALGTAVGGHLSDRVLRSRKWTVILGNTAAVLFLLPLLGVLSPRSPCGWGAVFALLGFFASFRTLMYAHAKEGVPLELAGTAVTAVNFFIMIGPALVQQTMGAVLERHPGEYRLAFVVPFTALAVADTVYVLTRDTHPSRLPGCNAGGCT
jgi:MFS family permease